LLKPLRRLFGPARGSAKVSYDFFLAHAGPDAAQAERLYDMLSAKSTVFLDTRSVPLGDVWDHVIAEAQRSSRLTVVLVSASTGAAFYQQEEIATAIGMAREDPTRHRVVPVYLGVTPPPYGLLRFQGLVVPDGIMPQRVAERLLTTLRETGGRAPESAGGPVQLPPAGGKRPAAVSSMLDKQCGALKESLARVGPWMFRDPRIAAERLAKAKTALRSVGPPIATWSAAAMRETSYPMADDLRELDGALRTRQAAVAAKLSALESVRSEDEARQPCADLAEAATRLFDACARAVQYVI
jgi:hypothetical protein